MDEPVRVRLYGLMSVTRRGYLAQLAVSAVLLVGLLLLWGYLESLKPAAGAIELPPTVRFMIALVDWLPWIVLAIAALYALEAFIVLRRFARKEAQQRTETSGSVTST